MGIIIGKFRKKKSTYDVLEKLQNEIVSIEEFGRNTELRRKKIVGRFIILAFSSYFLLALVVYTYYNRFPANHNYLYIVPLVACPLVFYLIKNFLTWYYSRKLRKNEKKLVKLKEDKKKILDNVMETETYKVAKKILDKFGNEIKKPAVSLMESTPMNKPRSSVNYSSIVASSQTGLRQRTVGPPALGQRISFGSQEHTPLSRALPSSPFGAVVSKSVTGLGVTPQMGTSLIPGPSAVQLPREVLPRDRSVIDRMVDYLIGDGPSQRYALICNKCFNHNGMALKEEFEYLSFKCCYCSHLNQSRKKRLSSQWELKTSPLKSRRITDSSDTDASSADSEADASKAASPEIRSDTPDTGRNSDFDKLSDLDAKEEEESGTAKAAEEAASVGGEESTPEPMEVENPVVQEPPAAAEVPPPAERVEIIQD